MAVQVAATPRAWAYIVAGAALLAAGALLGAQALVVAGGGLLLWVTLERTLALARVPRVTMELGAPRVREGGDCQVRVAIAPARAGQQVEVGLDPGLSTAGSNIVDVTRSARRIDHDLAVRAVVRGPRRIGPVRVRTWSPNRLLAADAGDGARKDLEVVPRPELADNVHLASRVLKPMAGRFNMNRPGQGFEFFSLRPYQSSDTIRDVNWKASARLDDLIVNQRLRETQTEILFLLDARVVAGAGPPGTTPLDRSCRVLLSLFEEAIRARDVVRVYVYGEGAQDAMPNATEKVHALEGMLARLPAAGMMPLREGWLAARPRMRSAGPVLVFSSLEADDTAVATLAEMASRGHGVTVVSPRPTGATWAGSRARQAARAALVDEARASGATVVDWEVGAPLMAAAPVLGGWAP